MNELEKRAVEIEGELNEDDMDAVAGGISLIGICNNAKQVYKALQKMAIKAAINNPSVKARR